MAHITLTDERVGAALSREFIAPKCAPAEISKCFGSKYRELPMVRQDKNLKPCYLTFKEATCSEVFFESVFRRAITYAASAMSICELHRSA
jgi:hypothetical protein